MSKNEELKQEQEDHEELTDVVEEGQQGSIDKDSMLIELSKQVDELKDRLLRQAAESENIRTRSAKAIDEARDYANFGFAKDLVPVMDNLTRALEHLPENLSDDIKNIIEGVSMTKRELESVFRRHSLESIHPESGEKFNYNLHHAISQIETQENEAGSIVTTMQTGYKIKDRLIRPAAVVVVKK
jgi:molecular chaperone GrpE